VKATARSRIERWLFVNAGISGSKAGFRIDRWTLFCDANSEGERSATVRGGPLLRDGGHADRNYGPGSGRYTQSFWTPVCLLSGYALVLPATQRLMGATKGQRCSGFAPGFGTIRSPGEGLCAHTGNVNIRVNTISPARIENRPVPRKAWEGSPEGRNWRRIVQQGRVRLRGMGKFEGRVRLCVGALSWLLEDAS